MFLARTLPYLLPHHLPSYRSRHLQHWFCLTPFQCFFCILFIVFYILFIAFMCNVSGRFIHSNQYTGNFLFDFTSILYSITLIVWVYWIAASHCQKYVDVPCLITSCYTINEFSPAYGRTHFLYDYQKSSHAWWPQTTEIHLLKDLELRCVNLLASRLRQTWKSFRENLVLLFLVLVALGLWLH